MLKLRLNIINVLVCLLLLSGFIIVLKPVGVVAFNGSLQGERIYQIMTDRFYDGDESNNAHGDALHFEENTEDNLRYMKGGDW